MQPSPNDRRVGIRIVTFEACSGFTRVTARRIAQPPMATFVTRLRPRLCTTEPLVSYRTYRQLSGWNPPPLVIRAVRAHGHLRTQPRTPVPSPDDSFASFPDEKFNQVKTVAQCQFPVPSKCNNLLDHVVSSREQRRRNGDAQILGSAHVDDELEHRRLLYRKINRFGSL